MIEPEKVIKTSEEFKYFCDNPNCTNHKLELNSERNNYERNNLSSKESTRSC